MTTEELIKLVGEEQPELLAKIAGAIQEIEVESPEALPEVLEDFNKIAGRIGDWLSQPAASGSRSVTRMDSSKNPVKIDESFETRGDKARGGVIQGLAGAAVAAGAGLAVAGGSDLYHAAKNKITEKHHYKKMLKAFPQMAEKRWDDNSEMTEEHQRRLPMAFKTLHKLAPDMASDPISAAALTRQLVLAPDSYEGLKKTLESQKTYGEGREKSRLRPFGK
jgi:hypothetical protein